MKYKELQKEGWITFEDNLDNEITDEELNELVYECYKNECKYKQGKVNSKLKERFNNLKNQTKEISKITNISIIRNAKLARREKSPEYNDFITVETEKKPVILLNINTGEDYSFQSNKTIALIKDKTTIETLYSYNENNFQKSINIGYIDKVIYYRTAQIYNSYSEKIIDESDFLEFKDTLGNHFYLDILYNNLYLRDIYSIYKTRFTKEKIVFKKDESLKLKNKIFENKLLKFLKLFYELED